MLTSMEKLSEMIRGARKGKRLTQPDVAKHLGLKKPISISNWERDISPIPWHHFAGLIELLEIPREQFLDVARREIPDAFNAFMRYFSGDSVIAKSQAAPGGADHIINVIRRLGRQERETLEFCAEAMASGDEEIRHHLIHQLRIVMDALKVRRPNIRGHPQKEQGGTSGPAKDRLERSAG